MSNLYANSRYYNQNIDFIQLEDGEDITPIIFYQFDDLTNVKYNIYTTAQGDKLYQLSYRFFGRPDLWWAIVEYNPQVTDFFNITPGTQLRIPNV